MIEKHIIIQPGRSFLFQLNGYDSFRVSCAGESKQYIKHIKRLQAEKNDLESALECERAYRYQVTESYERRLNSKVMALWYWFLKDFSEEKL